MNKKLITLGFFMMTLIVFSDAWGYKYGGINSFNYELCEAIKEYLTGRYSKIDATEAKSTVNLIVVSDFSDPERKKFEFSTYVKCVSIRKNELNLDNSIALLNEQLSNCSEGEIYFIGHDVITGEIAINCAKHFHGKSVIFRHMAYDEYYSQLTDSEEKIAAKKEQQKNLLVQADIVLGVGKKLTETAKQIVFNNKGHALVRQIVPGFNLQNMKSDYPSDQFRIYFAGRIEYQDEENNNNKIKQYDCVVKAFATLLKEGKIPPSSKLYLCGASSSGAKSHIKSVASKIHSGIVDIETISYAEHDKLMGILRNSSVAVMPSFSEGFGLVAVEAITSNVPIVISENSGIYRLIESEHLQNYIKHFEVSGENEKDINSLKECLLSVYRNQDDSRAWATELSKKLSEKYSWEILIGKLLKLLNVSRFYKNTADDFEMGLIEIFFPELKGGI